MIFTWFLTSKLLQDNVTVPKVMDEKNNKMIFACHFTSLNSWAKQVLPKLSALPFGSGVSTYFHSVDCNAPPLVRIAVLKKSRSALRHYLCSSWVTNHLLLQAKERCVMWRYVVFMHWSVCFLITKEGKWLWSGPALPIVEGRSSHCLSLPLFERDVTQ